MLNRQSLDNISRAYHRIWDDPSKTLTGISLYSGASPEGPIKFNFWLSDHRAQAMKDYLYSLNPSLDEDMFDIHSLGENYEGLVDFLKTSQMPWAGKALEIIDTTPKYEEIGSQYTSARKDRLRTLEGGSAWRYMLREYYPWLRRSRVVFHYSMNAPFPLRPITGRVRTDLPPPGLVLPKPKDDDRWEKRTILAVKTNLLYDAASAVNYGIEFPLGKAFSLVWEHYFPWWVMNSNKLCVQYLTLGGEARYWFRPQPRSETPEMLLRDVLTGHYFGAYGLWGKTDLQWKMKGRYQCAPVTSVGLTYGYVRPLTKHLNIELSLSAGYARIPYQHYNPSDDWQILWRDSEDAGVLHYFGPTKLQVSIVMPLQVKYRVSSKTEKRSSYRLTLSTLD